MRLVVDASTLVAELLRERGHRLISDPRLNLYVPAWMWEETQHEVSKRLDIRVSRGLPEPVAARFWDAAERVKEQSITEVPEELYEDLKDEALSLGCPAMRETGRRLLSRSAQTSSPGTKTSSAAA